METSAGELAELRQQLVDHPIYTAINDRRSLCIFMREHVFAVWDFMSLLKRLQREVTCVTLPWMPAADADLSRFILEIVLGEEADDDGRGGYASHYELYHQAMQELGAETQPIDGFLGQLQAGKAWNAVLQETSALPSTQSFVEFSLNLATEGQPHEVAAAFFYGREDIIPDMFRRMVETLKNEGHEVDRLRHYLVRHIELDGDHHGPLARRLVEQLCAGDADKLAAAEQTACEALRRRIALWDGILSAIRSEN
ncbi:DUF3050 domain-containing protein [bacterium]|nr:DUF3050 domain-containing protein [bacterium]